MNSNYSSTQSGNDAASDIKVPFHDNEAAFMVCQQSMKMLYDMGAEDAAKRELWDMCVIAEGGTPERKWGGADVSFNDEDGTFEVEKTLQPEILKSVEAEVTIGNTTQ